MPITHKSSLSGYVPDSSFLSPGMDFPDVKCQTSSWQSSQVFFEMPRTGKRTCKAGQGDRFTASSAFADSSGKSGRSHLESLRRMAERFVTAKSSSVLSSRQKSKHPGIHDLKMVSSLPCASNLNGLRDHISSYSTSQRLEHGALLRSGEKGSSRTIFEAVPTETKQIHVSCLNSTLRRRGMVLSRLQSKTEILFAMTGSSTRNIGGEIRRDRSKLDMAKRTKSYKTLAKPRVAGIEAHPVLFGTIRGKCSSEFKQVPVEILEGEGALPDLLLRNCRVILDRNIDPVARENSARGVATETPGRITR